MTNLNGFSIVFYHSHSPYMQCTKPWQTWTASQSYSIVLIVRTCDIRNHDRLKWFLNHILSFSVSVHETYETMTDCHQCGTRSGSPQLLWIRYLIKSTKIWSTQKLTNIDYHTVLTVIQQQTQLYLITGQLSLQLPVWIVHYLFIYIN